MLISPKLNFTILPVIAVQSPRNEQSIKIYTNDNDPPIKSNTNVSTLHPSVDLRLKFSATCGMYFVSVISILIKPSA